MTVDPHIRTVSEDMTQFTSIVTMSGGILISVRAHAGHISTEDQQRYLDGLELAYDGLCVSFHNIDLYSDIGDQQGPRLEYEYSDGVWTTP